ncbi:sigma 54-interacting transcriptional regulator [Brevibacillus sp. SYSU BS000544]|uniref:L-erythro-3,5-diaminohexanoate dehydrogenase n=1 Tax=Brevibacillus sp. SYSU BS000544 TaxID=3416443 RepID=UPI003CE53D52
MVQNCMFGTHRVIDPPHSLPQPAWKLDNTMNLHDNELLIDVETLNVNSVSFAQIYNECSGDKGKMADKIMKIVDNRGKLHNPITGTGGMLIGKIKEIGRSYQNPHRLSIGDKIASLTSLSLTPLKIHKINNIHMNTAQIEVQAEAILFQSAPVIALPSDLPLTEVMAVLDEAGALMQAWRLVQENDTVLIMGAGGKLGLLCAFAARKKLGTTGKIIGVIKTKDSRKHLQESGVFDEVIQTDALKSMNALHDIFKADELADITIDCINITNTETVSVLTTRPGGIVFFASLASNYNISSLTAEGIGRDVTIYAYKGYSEGHAEFAIQLLREHAKLRQMLRARFDRNTRMKAQAMVGSPIDLNSKVLKSFGIENFVFESEEIKQVLNNVLRVAMYDCTILLTGESGVGKEILAQASHKASSRSNSSLIKINCGSIPPHLLETEFFGYEGGSFTGARNQGKMGIFEAAHGGTLFLDEIGEMPIDLQVKLLRAIQEKEIYRVGGIKPIKVDVRIMAATNKNLRRMVEEGNFREDLFYRLNVFPVYIPPLRQRKADIIPLASFFLNKYNHKFQMTKSFMPAALSCLVDYSWPGNIREMENTIQRILINSATDTISEADIMDNISYVKSSSPQPNIIKQNVMKNSLEETEINILKEAKSKFKSTREMAKFLNMSQSTLIRRLKKYNI